MNVLSSLSSLGRNCLRGAVERENRKKTEKDTPTKAAVTGFGNDLPKQSSSFRLF